MGAGLAAALKSGPDDGVFSLWRVHAAGLGAVNVTLWLASLGLGKTWPVDFIWSTWPIVQALSLCKDAPQPRAGICLGLVSLWGGRLTWNFVSRGGIGHEDWRYSDMREQQGRFFWIGSLFTVFLAQSCFMFAGCLSLYPALKRSDLSTQTCALGAGLMASAVAIETLADRQMDAFLKTERRAGVMDQQLWAWSRHPNYFGEWLFWVGLWVFGGANPRSATAAGPGLMSALFLGVSVDLMEKRQLKRRGQAFKDYQRRVPSSFFPLPPSLQKALLGAQG